MGTPFAPFFYRLLGARIGKRVYLGTPLYDPNATSITPFAFWYPPVVAQVVAPISAVVPSEAFSWAWTGVLVACLLNFLGMPIFVLLPFYVEKALGAGADWYGFLLAAMSIGSVLGFAPGPGSGVFCPPWRSPSISAATSRYA